MKHYTCFESDWSKSIEDYIALRTHVLPDQELLAAQEDDLHFISLWALQIDANRKRKKSIEQAIVTGNEIFLTVPEVTSYTHFFEDSCITECLVWQRASNYEHYRSFCYLAQRHGIEMPPGTPKKYKTRRTRVRQAHYANRYFMDQLLFLFEFGFDFEALQAAERRLRKTKPRLVSP